MRPRVLVAGIGNIFLGDDAFGVELVQRLARRPLPDGVRVVDFGIRSLDLAYALQDDYEAVILVDAMPRGGRPGTLYVLEPQRQQPPDPTDIGLLLEAHALDPARVLRLAAAMGGRIGRLLVVGCEPEPWDEAAEMPTGLSGAVQVAVEEAVPLVESLLTRVLRGETELGAGDAGVG